jgi:hypothetical protein
MHLKKGQCKFVGRGKNRRKLCRLRNGKVRFAKRGKK